jgi:quinol monooxygenase YgiN
MSELKATAKFKIKPGQLEVFKSIVPNIVAAVREKDPATKAYSWYLNEDLMECVVWEVYANSEAVLAHAGNVGEYLGQLAEVADLTIEIYGSPSQELINAISGMDVQTYSLVDEL